MVRKTKAEAQATREHLLDTAERVFHDRGVSRTSLAEIALAAGVTRGAIYWHFENKADLFNAMMERVVLPFEQSIATVASAQADQRDPIAAIRVHVAQTLGMVANDERVQRVFGIAKHKVEYVDELLAVRDRHLRIRNDFHRIVERALRAAAQRGDIVIRLPVRAAAIGVFALIDGLIQNWMLDREAFDLVRTGLRVFDCYLRGLTVPEAPMGPTP
jgi:TetR/AcrR family acrAB operon transcriptional repressor